MLNPFTNRKILKNGLPSRATIIDMPPLDGGSGPSNIAMVLRIDLPGEHPYEIRDRWMVSGDESIANGDVIHVVVDRGNLHRVVIDWDKTREVLDRRQKAISQVMEPGIPLPVTKVRAAIEEVDPGHFDRRRPPTPLAPEPDDERELVGVGATSMTVENEEIELEDESLTSSLERLATLHAAGALTDGEFAAAKKHVLSTV